MLDIESEHNVHSRIVYVQMCRQILCMFDSSHALPFQSPLNSLVNAEVCFVKAFKSLSRTTWIQKSPPSIMDDHSKVQTFCFVLAKGFASFRPTTPPWPEASLPQSGKRSSLKPSPQPNGYSMAVSGRLYFTTNSFKRRNRPCFLAAVGPYLFT